jgi:iron complex transport system substrate-binding protein
MASVPSVLTSGLKARTTFDNAIGQLPDVVQTVPPPPAHKGPRATAGARRSRAKAGRPALLIVLVLLGVARPAIAQEARRIVSLIPATTEMLFAMGAGNRVVGVGNYDRFPADVEKLPRVGGLLDPDVERIIALKPDLVVVYATQLDLKRQLERAQIPMFSYEHRGLPDITETIRTLGARIGAREEAEAAAARIEEQLAALSKRVNGRPRPRTLLVFGREPGALRRLNASGGLGFLHDVLELAGGADVLGDLRRQSVDMSSEMVLARAPDVIIELHYGESMTPDAMAAEARVWSALPSVPAVRNNRVHLLDGQEFVVPGPRIVAAAERFARTLHPEAFK